MFNTKKLCILLALSKYILKVPSIEEWSLSRENGKSAREAIMSLPHTTTAKVQRADPGDDSVGFR